MKLLMTCTRMGVVVASPQSALQHDYICEEDAYTGMAVQEWLYRNGCSGAGVPCSALVQSAVLATSIHCCTICQGKVMCGGTCLCR